MASCSHPHVFSVAHILAAQRRLTGRIVTTPLLSHPALNDVVGGRVLIKAECLQSTGSFKLRGALNALLTLMEDPSSPPPQGVVAWSSGNHAQAVALAARQAGLPAIIVMPKDAPQAKIQGTRRLGGSVVLYDRIRESREEIGRAIATDKDYAIIPPYDHQDVMAGQGTIGLEVAAQATALGLQIDQVGTAVSGGGLLSGVSTAIQATFPQCEAFAAEPQGHDDLRRTLEAGEIVANSVSAPSSLCDALMAPRVGEAPYPVLRKRVRQSFAVSDADVQKAMAWAFHALKLVVEPGGAAPLAALISGQWDGRDKTTAVVLSGGNVDASVFAPAIAVSPLPACED